MKKLIALILLTTVIYGCKKSDSTEEINKKLCNNAKVVWVTCAGTVIQLLKDSIGKDYSHFDQATKISTMYKNCVMAENLTNTTLTDGEITSISYELTEKFKGNVCALGVFPSKPIKISIKKIYTNCPIPVLDL